MEKKILVILMKDYYKILNVSKDSTQEEIKKKYVEKARKYHPDKNKNNQDKLKIFKMISEAYEILGDPYNRGRYDAQYENRIPDLFNFSFSNPFSLFEDLKEKEDIFKNLPKNSKSKSYSYVSSSVNKNGETRVKQKISVKNNGKKEKYYTEFVKDKDGNIKTIKEEGNKNLLPSNINNLLKLKDYNE